VLLQGFWERRAARCALAKGTGIIKVAKTVGQASVLRMQVEFSRAPSRLNSL